LRVVHLTFYKCASQWVRDILTDPEVSAVTGFPLSLNSVDVATGPWPEQPCDTFAGPIYGASSRAWLNHSLPDDRAIVVIRDPRDIVISLMYSVAFNHAPTINTLLLRSPMERASTKDRVRLGMHLITGWADALKSWGGFEPTGRELMMSYKAITEDPKGQFHRILQFVGWQVPEDVFDRVLDRFSFEKMTGRKRGESNVYSHHRKGVDGDWRNYFDRELGYEFEETFPGMLTALGFERTNEWYASLPDDIETLREDAVPESETNNLLMKIARLEHLHQEAMDVDLWRTAAEDRLTDIQRLTATVERLRANFAERKQVAEERLADILKLNEFMRELEARVQHVSQTADERLAKLIQLTETVQRLEARAADAEQVALDRYEQIQQLDGAVRAAREEAEHRLADVDRLNQAVRAAENAADLRLAQIHQLHGVLDAAQTELGIARSELGVARSELGVAQTELGVARSELKAANDTAVQRLGQIETLRQVAQANECAAAERLTAIKELSKAADERLADIHKLTDMVHDARATADERLEALERLTLQYSMLQDNFDRAQIAAIDHAAFIRELEASFSYRFGFRPIAAVGGILRRFTRAQKAPFAQNRGV
jgi:hypothetical protein